jgi:hypothetical protein
MRRTIAKLTAFAALFASSHALANASPEDALASYPEGLRQEVLSDPPTSMIPGCHRECYPT